MECDLFVAETVVNNVQFTNSLFDPGSSAFATITSSLVQQLRLPRIPIKPRTVDGVGGVQSTISEVATFDADIDGHKERMFAYVIPRAPYPIILGLPWVKRHVAVYDPRTDQVVLHSSGTIISRAGARRAVIAPTQVLSSVFGGYIKRSHHPSRPVEIFSASLADIEKALRPKTRHSLSDIRGLLPPDYAEFATAFATHDEKLPKHRDGMDMAIDLEPDENGRDPQIPWGPLYSMSRDELLVLRKTLTELLDQGFIRVSHSSAASPVLFAKKPGGGLRFCVDYRALNAITKKDRYPIPLISETLRQVSQAKWFTKFDVRAAFHRLRITEGDEWKTAFRTRYGLFEWLVCPFGLANAPSLFQRYVNWTLRDFLDDFVSAYIDDILVYTNGTLEEHRRQVKLVLGKLEAAGLCLDIDKCAFEVKTVKYLGLVLEAGMGIRMDPDKVAAISKWESPKSVKGVRSFLGFANYYREFIPGFSELTLPLTTLTKKGVLFQWTDACQRAFEELKKLFVTEPLLTRWDPDRVTIVETDASNFAVGGVLSQVCEDSLRRPVAYFSCKLTPAQRNYGIHDKELLGVISALTRWRAELRGVERFTILTDHRNLEYFRTKQVLNTRQVSWMQMLQDFPPFTTAYRPGTLNAAADALSRQESDEPEDVDDGRTATLWTSRTDDSVVDPLAICPLEICEHGDRRATASSPFLPDSAPHDLWHQALQSDPNYTQMKQDILNNQPRFSANLHLQQVAQIGDCMVEGSAIRHRGNLWIPNYEPLQTALLQQIHDSSICGHPGRESTLAITQRQFFWPGLTSFVRRFLRNCHICGKGKIWRQRKRGLLQPLPIPARAWTGISTDFMTDLPPTRTGATNMLIITCRLTGNVILEDLVTIDTPTVADAFLKCFFRHHGFPEWIVSDRGTQWVSGLWARLCELLGIDRKLSTSHHQQTDGGNERMNQEVHAYLRCYTTFSQQNWADLLPAAQLAINNRPRGNGPSPFFATHGHNVSPIQEVTEHAAPGSAVAQAEELVDKLREVQDWISAATASRQERMKNYADGQREATEQFRIGDSVWLDMRHISQGRRSKKLSWLHQPYKITKEVSPMVYELDVPAGIHNQFHVELLRKVADDPHPSQDTHSQPPEPIVDETGSLLYFVDEILCATSIKGERYALVKWSGYDEPEFTAINEIENLDALDKWEASWGPITENDGPRDKYLTRTGRIRGALRRVRFKE